MPEIKNTFLKGRMNKDLDERIIPKGEYRDALNINISTSEEADVGTVQTILGNKKISNLGGGVCVGSISNEKTNKIYWFNIKPNSGVNEIIEYDQNNNTSNYVFVDLKANTDEPVLNFPNKIITGINIINDLLFWTDGEGEPKKINIERCKTGTNQNGADHTKLVVNGVNTGVDIKEENITVIKKKPTKSPVIVTNYTETDSPYNKKAFLFEKTFSRFAYRYKYEDGEYSAFGPFSEVVFNPQYVKEEDSFLTNETSYTSKEPFNKSMLNRIDSIDIHNFVCPDTPDDVVEVEILYKQEDSPVIYSITKIKKDSSDWLNQDYSGSNSFFTGKYTIKTENIYAALPENQFIRVFDAVPRKAIAQEITGNRLVYANYTQNYNINEVGGFNEYDVFLSGYYQDRINNQTSYDSPLKSLKSLKDYQLGVVFGDKYGRETPVFTSANSSIKIPWKDDSNDLNASRSLALRASIATNFPTWASYFKFYIKETSTEYYNLLMDKLFIPSSQDDIDRNTLSEHVWISFFSTDRNKLKIEDHIVLKKIFGRSGQVAFNNRFKVIDIKNEAPDSIRFDFHNLGSVTGTEVSANLFTTGNDIISTTDTLIIDQSVWHDNNNGATIKQDDNSTLEQDMFVEWTNGGVFSKKYRVKDVRDDTGGNYKIKLKEVISSDDASLAKDSAGIIDTNVIFQISRKELRDLDMFSGRYFVKISSNNLTSEIRGVLEQVSSSATAFLTQNIRWWCNKISDAAGDKQSEVLINHEGIGTPSTATVNSVDLDSGVTTDATSWANLADAHKGFFIDSMYFCAGNTHGDTRSKASDAVDIMRGMTGAGATLFNTATGKTIGMNYADPIWTNDLIHPITNPVKNLNNTNPSNFGTVHPNYLGSNASQAPDITKNYFDYAFISGSNPNPMTVTGIPENPGGQAKFYASVLGQSAPRYRWAPYDKDAQSAGGYYYINHGPSFFYGATYTSYLVVKTLDPPYVIPSNSNYNYSSPYSLSNFTQTNHVEIGDVSTTSNGRIGFSYPFSITGTINTDDIVNGLDGIVITNSEHTNGGRMWRGKGGRLYNEREFDADFAPYGEPGSEGKTIMHLSFLAPGSDLIADESNFDLSNAEIKGENCIGAYLQGIHGGGVFTKSAFDIDDDYSEFKDGPINSRRHGPRIIECETSTVNTSNLNIGYDSNYQTLHDDQWDPVKSQNLTQAQKDKVFKFIQNLTKTNSKFKFSADTSNTIYTIKSCSIKYLYNHTPWRRRYVWKETGSTGPFTDLYGLNENMIEGGDSVEEAAVAWAKATANNSLGTEQTELETRIKNFGKAHNRRTVYVLEIVDENGNPADFQSATFNPVDGDNGVTAGTNTLFEFVEFSSLITENSISTSNAVWETEPETKTDLNIYYEASDALPTRLTIDNAELYAPIGCKVQITDKPESNPGTDVILQSFSEDADGNLFINVSPSFNTTDSNNNTIVYSQASSSSGGVLTPAITSNVKFIKQDGSYTTAKIIAPTGTTPSVVTGASFVISRTASIGNDIGLNWYNCFSFGNGIESNRIRDDFNQMQITNGARVSAVLEEPYKEETRTNGLIYSGIYNTNSSINNLNQFVIGEKITKDLNPTYGSIQKLFQRRISLVAFCEDKVVSIVSNKDALFNADGNPQLISSNNVLGDATPFVGDYGISKNPESFASDSYRAYFADKQRGAVLRLSMDGLTPISDAGMSDYFRDNLSSTKQLIGNYDAYNEDYNLTLKIDDPQYNIIKNSFFSLGVEFVDQGLEEFLDNTELNHTSETTYPLSLQYTSDEDYSHPDGIGSGEIGVVNQYLNSWTRIIEYPSIAIGAFQTADNSGASSPGSGFPGDPGTSYAQATAPIYNNINETIFSFYKITGGLNSNPAEGTVFNSSNITGTFYTNGSIGVTGITSSSYSTLGGGIDYSNPLYFRRFLSDGSSTYEVNDSGVLMSGTLVSTGTLYSISNVPLYATTLNPVSVNTMMRLSNAANSTLYNSLYDQSRINDSYYTDTTYLGNIYQRNTGPDIGEIYFERLKDWNNSYIELTLTNHAPTSGNNQSVTASNIPNAINGITGISTGTTTQPVHNLTVFAGEVVKISILYEVSFYKKDGSAVDYDNTNSPYPLFQADPSNTSLTTPAQQDALYDGYMPIQIDIIDMEDGNNHVDSAYFDDNFGDEFTVSGASYALQYQDAGYNTSTGGNGVYSDYMDSNSKLFEPSYYEIHGTYSHKANARLDVYFKIKDWSDDDTTANTTNPFTASHLANYDGNVAIGKLGLRIRFKPNEGNSRVHIMDLGNNDLITVQKINVLNVLGIQHTPFSSPVAELLAVPSATVPGWTAVQHVGEKLDTAGLLVHTDNYSLMHGIKFPQAINDFGNDNHITSNTVEGGFNWVTPNPNTVTIYQSSYDNADVYEVKTQDGQGNITTTSGSNLTGVKKDDFFKFECKTNIGAAKFGSISKNLDTPMVVDNWYLLDIIYKTIDRGTSSIVGVDGVIDPSNLPSAGTVTFGDSGYLNGFFGVIHSDGKVDGLNIDRFDDISFGYRSDLHNYANVSSSSLVVRVIFQVQANSPYADPNNTSYDLSTLNILTHDTDIEVDSIALIDISEKVSVGDVDKWRYNKQYVSLVNEHSLSPIQQYVKNNAIHFDIRQGQRLFDEGTLPSAAAHKYFNFFFNDFRTSVGLGNDKDNVATDNGYELTFEIDDEYFTNNFQAGNYINCVGLGEDGLGFEVKNIDVKGIYKVLANFDNNTTTVNGDDWGVEIDVGNGFEDPSDVGSSCNIITKDESSSSLGTWPRYEGNLMFLFGSNSLGSLKSVSLLERTPNLIGGSINSWTFNNFDSATSSNIVWNNGTMLFNTTTTNPASSNNIVFASQELPADFNYTAGAEYNLSFNYEIFNSGPTRLLVYITDASNRNKIMLTTPNINSINITKPQGVVHSFNKNFTISNTTTLSGSLANNFTAGSICIWANDTTPVGQGTTVHNFSLDNIVLRRVVRLTNDKTISYSEDVKGWTSFKSFVPEQGLSLSKQYFTIKNGRLYHHNESTVDYNNFYGLQYDSHITTIINDEPSLIKSFKTLSYEGSQSKVVGYEQQTISSNNFSDISFSNLVDKKGWYVDYITTNKQEGFVPDFIEKEGKWFNYIKGGLSSISESYVSQHTGDLNFQGISEIKAVSDVTTAVTTTDPVTGVVTTIPATTTTIPTVAVTTPTPSTTTTTSPGNGTGGY